MKKNKNMVWMGFVQIKRLKGFESETVKNDDYKGWPIKLKTAANTHTHMHAYS